MRHNKNSFDYKGFFKKNLIGLVLIGAIFLLIGILKIGIVPQNIAMGETIPFYEANAVDSKGNLKLTSVEPKEQETFFVASDYQSEHTQQTEEIQLPKLTDLIGVDDITYQPETDQTQAPSVTKEIITAEDLEKLKDIDYLKKSFYIIDKRTNIDSSDIDAEEFLNKDFKIDNTVSGPKVLIFHTHSTEGFSDSDMTKDMSEGIWGVGEKLKEILENKYGIETIHDSGRYDIVDGKGQIIGAYERMEPSIRKILQQYPSIQVVIDMHRDGVPETTHLVKNIDGKDCAQVMFFNGLCKLYKNGTLGAITGLENEYVRDNLAFSFNMQVTANTVFPTFTRRVYLNAYRYSLHMLPKSLLIEVGAQTNTKQEALNAMEPLAEVLADVILKK